MMQESHQFTINYQLRLESESESESHLHVKFVWVLLAPKLTEMDFIHINENEDVGL